MDDREYQQKAIKYLCSTFRGILKAPAGSGKTHVAASALSQCLSKRKTRAAVEIMVNTREQVDQMETACARFDIAARCDLQIYCAAGAPSDTKPDLIIVDECHHCSAATWAAKVQSCTGGRWGLSATPFDDKTPEQVAVIKSMFTNQIHEIQRAELVDNGHLSKARVIWRDVDCGGIADKIESLASDFIEKRSRSGGERCHIYSGTTKTAIRIPKRGIKSINAGGRRRLKSDYLKTSRAIIKSHLRRISIYAKIGTSLF
jgi:superfamily II DNA or RNA helicase